MITLLYESSLEKELRTMISVSLYLSYISMEEGHEASSSLSYTLTKKSSPEQDTLCLITFKFSSGKMSSHDHIINVYSKKPLLGNLRDPMSSTNNPQTSLWNPLTSKTTFWLASCTTNHQGSMCEATRVAEIANCGSVEIWAQIPSPPLTCESGYSTSCSLTCL